MAFLITAPGWARGGDGSNNGGGRVELNLLFAQNQLATLLGWCAEDARCVLNPQQASDFRGLSHRLTAVGHPAFSVDETCHGEASFPGFLGLKSWGEPLMACPADLLDASGEPRFGSLGELTQRLAQVWWTKLHGPFVGDWDQFSAGLRAMSEAGLSESIVLSASHSSFALLSSTELNGQVRDLLVRDEDRLYDLVDRLNSDAEGPCQKLSAHTTHTQLQVPQWIPLSDTAGSFDGALRAQCRGADGSAFEIEGNYRFDVQTSFTDAGIKVGSLQLFYESLRRFGP